MSDQVQVCVHCHNPVERIDYGEKQKYLTRGELENVFKHGRPRPYPICSVSPIMDEDTEWVDADTLAGE